MTNSLRLFEDYPLFALFVVTNSLRLFEDYPLFALFVLFAIRDYSLFGFSRHPLPAFFTTEQNTAASPAVNACSCNSDDIHVIVTVSLSYLVICHRLS